jgi:hypothetical protein
MELNIGCTFRSPELGSTELWINGEFGVREERLASSPRHRLRCFRERSIIVELVLRVPNRPATATHPRPTTMDRAIDPSKPLCAATATTSRRQPLSIRPIRPSVQRSAVASFAGAFCLWTQASNQQHGKLVQRHTPPARTAGLQLQPPPCVLDARACSGTRPSPCLGDCKNFKTT